MNAVDTERQPNDLSQSIVSSKADIDVSWDRSVNTTEPNQRPVLIGPSLLTADFGNLAAEIARAEAAGVDFIHLDIMDGHFVPNLSFGPVVVEAVRGMTELPLDVHLMIEDPESYLTAYANAGATIITIHVETTDHLHAALTQIRESGAAPGVTLNPLTSLEAIIPAIPFVEQILVMSVNPGFGGQTFLPFSLRRIEALRKVIDDLNPHCRLEVDGGIKPSNLARVVDAGATMVVAGSAIFSNEFSVADGVAALRAAVRDVSA